MKITAIELKDFRAFASNYRFDFAGGKNLAVYGENGSGKSSLFRAILEFFNLDPTAKPFEDHRNVFTEPPRTDGHVTVHFDDGSSPIWPCGGGRSKDPKVPETAIRLGCVDYRALLKTNFIHFGDKVNLFDLAVTSLLANYPVSIPGTGNTTIGQLWRQVTASKPPTRRRGNLRRAGEAADRFNQALEPELPKLAAKAEELLASFENCNVKLEFEFPKLICNKAERDFIPKELNLVVSLNRRKLTSHHHFLNEARLSAIALALYLSSLLISVPAPVPGAPEYPKLLVLDDVLIGLDMSNRMPVLDILGKHLGDWQILLMTYDKVWFEMVRLQTQGDPDWHCDELYLGDLDCPVHKPQEKGSDHFLTRAREHLAVNDHQAAAVYIRSSFETKIKKFCENKRLKVQFRNDPRRVTSESFWDATKSYVNEQIAKKPAGDPEGLALEACQKTFNSVEMYRKVVLNPLNHAGFPAITRAEIQGAIDAIASLALPK